MILNRFFIHFIYQGKHKSNLEGHSLQKSAIEGHLIPIRPDRSFERNPEKYRTRIKPKVTKNQKDGV